MRAIQRLYRDESGTVVIMVGAIIALLLAFSVMAIDAPQMMLVKTQLQNAADAGALSAILAIGLSSDTSAAAPAAIVAAGANQALIGAGVDNVMDSIIITSADVTFPNANTVRVRTHRTTADGDPYLNYFLGIFEPARDGEMEAWAAAQFSWVCAGNCIMPWAPPDRWYDANGNDEFDPDGVTNPDEYYDPILTGYTNADLGTPISIVLANGNAEGFGQFWYYSVCLPPINKGDPLTGGDVYREWMCEGCVDNTFSVEEGDQLMVEPGKKVGPNGDGLDCLIDSDPLAEWDDATGTVINSAYPISPRIVKAALFNPAIGWQDDLNGRKYITVTKIFVLFVEGSSGGAQIDGRFMRMNEPGGEACEDQVNPTFLYAVKLVE